MNDHACGAGIKLRERLPTKQARPIKMRIPRPAGKEKQEKHTRQAFMNAGNKFHAACRYAAGLDSVSSMENCSVALTACGRLGGM
jgi:hypothetical protein